ncbi:MAG: methylamine utilization protein MauG, partial [Paracoccaceae bacterium]|nr:methylamine utilization protein MauG [Paracoccaceae bacterium]
PYGHNGTYPTLEGIVRHHLNPVAMRADWSRDMAQLPRADHIALIDFIADQDTREIARQEAAIAIAPVALDDASVLDLVAFLNALTGVTAETRPLGRPDTVPSGLSVD